jgi:YggT family protein
MHMLIYIINLAFNIYIGIIIVQVAVSWLMAFDVINSSNDKAQNLVAALKKATDPVYKPIQKYIPPIGGIDITPLIVILGLALLRDVIINILI